MSYPDGAYSTWPAEAGNGAIAAARRNRRTAVGVDYVPGAAGRTGASARRPRGYDVEFVEGDAQELPFEDASFDVVLSTFGAMFAPDQEKTAAELLRVCRSGGRDRDGELDAGRPRRRGIVATIAEHAPPPPGIQPAVRCGAPRSGSGSCSATGSRSSRLEPRTFNFRYRSPEHWLEYFRDLLRPDDDGLRAGRRRGRGGARERPPGRRARGQSRRRCGRWWRPAEYVEVVAVRA